MRRAYTPKDITKKRWKTLPWGKQWSEPFGYPAIDANWFISGASASGKSSFVFQLAKELCKYGTLLYLSLEEGINQTFQRRIEIFKMEEVQNAFRVITECSLNELKDRLRRPKSPKFIVIDSFQVADWDYRDTERLTKEFPSKCFIFISQEKKSEPMGAAAVRLKYWCDVKVRVVGYEAICQGRATSEVGATFRIWDEGIMKASNSINEPTKPTNNE